MSRTRSPTLSVTTKSSSMPFRRLRTMLACFAADMVTGSWCCTHGASPPWRWRHAARFCNTGAAVQGHRRIRPTRARCPAACTRERPHLPRTGWRPKQPIGGRWLGRPGCGVMLLVPANPPRTRHPDEHFAAEVEAARSAGLYVGVVDHEALARADDVERAVASVSAGGTAVYRGWMLRSEHHAAIPRRGIAELQGWFADDSVGSRARSGRTTCWSARADRRAHPALTKPTSPSLRISALTARRRDARLAHTPDYPHHECLYCWLPPSVRSTCLGHQSGPAELAPRLA
jgi:hypothetical protein